MKYSELIENKSHPCIVVDVQPEYSGINDGNENPVFEEIIQFVNNQTGPVLMFVNAEEHGVSGDTIDSIKEYWEDSGFNPDSWHRIQIIDKGYGYLRNWMDMGVPDKIIIQTIRLMYKNNVNSTEDLEENKEFIELLKQTNISDTRLLFDPITIVPVSIAKLKQFNGAYIMGGGRNECLREVELLMNAFNIKYKRIDSLVYG